MLNTSICFKSAVQIKYICFLSFVYKSKGSIDSFIYHFLPELPIIQVNDFNFTKIYSSLSIHYFQQANHNHSLFYHIYYYKLMYYISFTFIYYLYFINNFIFIQQ